MCACVAVPFFACGDFLKKKNARALYTLFCVHRDHKTDPTPHTALRPAAPRARGHRPPAPRRTFPLTVFTTHRVCARKNGRAPGETFRESESRVQQNGQQGMLAYIASRFLCFSLNHIFMSRTLALNRGYFKVP